MSPVWCDLSAVHRSGERRLHQLPCNTVRSTDIQTSAFKPRRVILMRWNVCCTPTKPTCYQKWGTKSWFHQKLFVLHVLCVTTDTVFLIVSKLFCSMMLILHVNHILTCRLFDDGRCEIRCQKGRYAMGRQCHLCHHTCQECADEGPDSCTSCDRGKLTWVWNHSDDFFSPNLIIKSTFSSKNLCIVKSKLS